jgi:uncharacterized MnhB-related membrane protein
LENENVDLEKEYTLLTIVSFFFGIFVLIVTLQWVAHGGLGLNSIIVAGLFGLGAGLLYPVVGAAVVRLCEGLRFWAYQGDIERWSKRQKITLGALWPVTLITALMAYVFLGVIYRAFRK